MERNGHLKGLLRHSSMVLAGPGPGPGPGPGIPAPAFFNGAGEYVGPRGGPNSIHSVI